MVFMVTSEVSSTARTSAANALSAFENCLEYSHGLPVFPGILAEVLKQFSEELVTKFAGRGRSVQAFGCRGLFRVVSCGNVTKRYCAFVLPVSN